MKQTTFTWVGLAVVIVLIIVFIRTRFIIGLLGVILLGLVLINYNKISPVLFNHAPKLN